MDINNECSLVNFIERCNAVVNCVGPSSSIKTDLAKLCHERGIHLIDLNIPKNIPLNIEKSSKGLLFSIIEKQANRKFNFRYS